MAAPMVNTIIPLVLRRMRAPLVVLILAYAVSVLGMVLIPGTDADGDPWRMDFFHAFYFVSYMATTIGFGEIPYAFNDAQRAWTIIALYITVIAWLYAIGKILTLMQDPAFRHAVTEQAFARSIRHLKEPFVIVCGHGDTGSILVRALGFQGLRSVVIDVDAARINAIRLENYETYVPGLMADARDSAPLLEAGLLNPYCAGVVAITGSDEVNLKIAITSKLLAPELRVICRADSQDTQANLASFGTDDIINPFDVFADRLALALHSPSSYLIHEWLTSVPDSPLSNPLYPSVGTWVLCGYGRFGKAVKSYLDREGVSTIIVESDPEGADCVGQCVMGRGTEADTLQAADIEQAAGIVAGTDDDANNLSIIMTARTLKPDLFMVARQNERANDLIFEAAHLDLVMQRSETIARKVLVTLTSPLLGQFLSLIRSRSNDWANQLASRLSAITGEVVPETWTIELDRKNAPAAIQAFKEGGVRLDDLMRDPRGRDEYLPVLPLLLVRGAENTVLPEADTKLQPGDCILFCSPMGVRQRMYWNLRNENVLRYIQTGEEHPSGMVWRWLRSGTVSR